jgi:hypothetical protein
MAALLRRYPFSRRKKTKWRAGISPTAATSELYSRFQHKGKHDFMGDTSRAGGFNARE